MGHLPGLLGIHGGGFTSFTGVHKRCTKHLPVLLGFMRDAWGLLPVLLGMHKGLTRIHGVCPGGFTHFIRIWGPCVGEILLSILQSQAASSPAPCLSFPKSPRSPVRLQHGTNHPERHELGGGYTPKIPPSPSSLSAISFWSCCARALALSRSSSASASCWPRLLTCTRSSSWGEKMV